MRQDMLNRRILRIKVFKVLYSSMMSGNVPLAEAESDLDASCEATRDLYLFMLGIVSPLTKIARERIEAARNKFNPTDEERNPNMKFADNALAALLDSDPDFTKIFNKKKFSWEQYDLFLKKIYASVCSREYYRKYMSAPGSSLAEDCRLFISIFENEFADSEDLERILEDMSILWNDDLAYSLTFVCRTLESLAKGGRWALPPLYMSDMMKKPEMDDDRLFAKKLLRSAYTGYPKYSAMVSESVSNWDKERIVSTDMVLIVQGMAEAAVFPEIPVKVTINEYVEISKFYGTPKSRIFVNGLLDRLIQKMSHDGLVQKSGKGLM